MGSVPACAKRSDNLARAATPMLLGLLRGTAVAMTVYRPATIHEQQVVGTDRCRRMGLVMVKIKLINFEDVRDVERGLIREDAVRSLEVEALADTGAINLAIPEGVARALGLPIIRRDRLTVADGRKVELPIAGAVAVEIFGRRVTGEAIVLPEGSRTLLGAVQLEMMDLVVVPSSGEVITNPAHPDGKVLPLLRLAG
jgi:clan AA aspartic protease